MGAPLSDSSTGEVRGDVVFQPARADVERERATFASDISLYQGRVDDYNAEVKAGEMGVGPRVPEARKGGNDLNKILLKDAKEKMKSLVAFGNRMQLGTVYAVPGSFKNSTHGCIRDWAIIKLDKTRLDKAPRNLFPEMRPEFLGDARIAGPGREILATNFTRNVASEILPVTTVTDILQFSGSFNHRDNRSLRVLKHGRTSGWTCGSLNEIRSDILNQLEGHENFVTTEWCIINIPRLNNFSFGGDSGSCVIDHHGKIVGMLHWGNAKQQCFDAEVTYVTPMEWVIEDIKTTLGTNDVTLEENLAG